MTDPDEYKLRHELYGGQYSENYSDVSMKVLTMIMEGLKDDSHDSIIHLALACLLSTGCEFLDLFDQRVIFSSYDGNDIVKFGNGKDGIDAGDKDELSLMNVKIFIQKNGFIKKKSTSLLLFNDKLEIVKPLMFMNMIMLFKSIEQIRKHKDVILHDEMVSVLNLYFPTSYKHALQRHFTWEIGFTRRIYANASFVLYQPITKKLTSKNCGQEAWIPIILVLPTIRDGMFFYMHFTIQPQDWCVSHEQKEIADFYLQKSSFSSSISSNTTC